MPIYEYTCPSCGAGEECLEPLAAPPTHDCPACGAQQGMARRLSVAALATSSIGPGRGARSEPPCGGGCACPYAG